MDYKHIRYLLSEIRYFKNYIRYLLYYTTSVRYLVCNMVFKTAQFDKHNISYPVNISLYISYFISKINCFISDIFNKIDIIR